jgi:hypothetical protein
MSVAFFILGVIGVIYSVISISFTPEEKLRDSNNSGVKLMIILLASLLLAGLNVTAILSDPLVTEIIKP